MPTRRTENGTEHDIRRCNVIYYLESLFQSLAYNRIEVEKGQATDFSGVAVIRFTNKNDCKKAKHIAKRKLLCKAIKTESPSNLDLGNIGSMLYRLWRILRMKLGTLIFNLPLISC
nr:hypothetical protein [Tanacetum cinerariifolium]